MKLLKKVGAALVSLAMLAAAAFTTVASAEKVDLSFYGVKGYNDEYGLIYDLKLENVPEDFLSKSSIMTADIVFGNTDFSGVTSDSNVSDAFSTTKWLDNHIMFVAMPDLAGGTVFSGRIMDKNSETKEEALLAFISLTDGVFSLEMAFDGNSEYIAEVSKCNSMLVYLSCVVSENGEMKQLYLGSDGNITEKIGAHVIGGNDIFKWEDFTVTTTETPEESAEPVEEPTEPTEEPIESTEPDETEEPIISEEPVESIEPEETEAPEVIAPDEPETEVPEAPAEPAPAVSASAASTSTTNKGNPDTGVAVAVVPLLIAGAGTAVLTRKRK